MVWLEDFSIETLMLPKRMGFYFEYSQLIDLER